MASPTETNSTLAAAVLARSLEDFLAEHPHAAILEDGRLLFDLRLASCSVSADHGRCLLHLWSEDRNLVRTISAIQPRRDTLRIETYRFGQAKPQALTFVPNPEFRTPSARDTSRRRYQRVLEQALAVQFPGWSPESFRSAMDLEHSFGPAYARGILTKGQSAWAVLGVGPDEAPATIEGALTLGILWLDYCRAHSGGRRVIHGLRLIVPCGQAATSAARMAWLDPTLAQWELLELNPSTAELALCSIGGGNLSIQLPHAFDPQAALERSAVAIAHLKSLLPAGLLDATEIRPRSSTEIAFSLHGLEYARIRHGLIAGSFTHRDEIFFGAGPSETLLDETTEDLFRDLMHRLFESRHRTASTTGPLFRLQPERWLESILRRDPSILHCDLAATAPVYSQLFSLSSSSRNLLDLLTVTRKGRLAVLELKADDDLHLPLQALDYWARIRTLHREGRIARNGYFPGVELSAEDPLLLCVAPALHVHPANETVFRAFAPGVPWEFIVLDEHWREECRVVLRKRA